MSTEQRENLDAIDFLRGLNEAVSREPPGVQTIAEESTAWPLVSRPTYLGGLGFGYKWNMGWMHDTLGYFQQDPIHRRYHHHELTFSLVYAFSENFVLPISHDEVVHGKSSMYSKMPGDRWQKLANLRAREFVRGSQEVGGLHTVEDLANWKVHLEEPVKTTYKGIDVYKLDFWTQGPAMLQALNILEPMDVKAMGYNSTRYLHAIYQAMNLAFADRDFYYGDPYFPPAEPIAGLLSKEYAKARATKIDWTKNDPNVKPGDPYPFEGGTNPVPTRLAGLGFQGLGPQFRKGAAGEAKGFLLVAAASVGTPSASS